MDKYYTPEIGEFHIGFEFERTVSAGGDDWYKDTITEMWQFEQLGKYEKTRVKYLDQEDIESLGWVQLPGQVDTMTFRKSVLYFGEAQDFRLIYNPLNHWLEINQPSEMETNYYGVCKNLSKLKVILKDLGV